MLVAMGCEYGDFGLKMRFLGEWVAAGCESGVGNRRWGAGWVGEGAWGWASGGGCVKSGGGRIGAFRFLN